jgi:hypothetical protein
LTASNLTLSDNQAVGGAGNSGGVLAGEGIGGGLACELGTVASVISNSTIDHNQAIGGQGVAGASGSDGLGGGISNFLGSTLTVSSCTLSGNQALGGAGGVGANGGNGLGGSIFNDGLSILPANFGTPATLTVSGNTITGNQATGGAAGGGGSAGQGIGGGVYFATGGVVCLDSYTVTNIFGNTASTSNNDIFGDFTICP